MYNIVISKGKEREWSRSNVSEEIIVNMVSDYLEKNHSKHSKMINDLQVKSIQWKSHL